VREGVRILYEKADDLWLSEEVGWKIYVPSVKRSAEEGGRSSDGHKHSVRDGRE
jgi:hypothetical protein